jgi:hypothetical protein
MDTTTRLLVALLLAGVNASHAAIRVADDRGGRIGNYLDRYEAIRTSGETVIIDGQCLSACTMVLGAVSHDRICVTSQASLGLHTAYAPVALASTDRCQASFWRQRQRPHI